MIVNEFIYPLRVHIEDTDFSGLVFHSNYLKFMERARSEWMEEVGLGMNWQQAHKIFFLIHSIQIRFLKPARVHEKIEVVTSIKEIRSASLVYDQYLRPADSTDKMLCRAEIKLACVDETMRPQVIPKTTFLDSMRRILT